MLSQKFQTGDWKGEKHVPYIQAPEKVKKGENFEVKVHIGEEVGHPNTYEHYIAWIKLYFQPEDAKFPVEVGTYEFDAHGEYDIFTEPEVITTLKVNASGEFYAVSYCNIHGLWENKQSIIAE